VFERVCAEGMDLPPKAGRRRTNIANVPPYLGQLPPIILRKRLHLQGWNHASYHPARFKTVQES
jgi:hypothetical protein